MDKPDIEKRALKLVERMNDEIYGLEYTKSDRKAAADIIATFAQEMQDAGFWKCVKVIKYGMKNPTAPLAFGNNVTDDNERDFLEIVAKIRPSHPKAPETAPRDEKCPHAAVDGDICCKCGSRVERVGDHYEIEKPCDHMEYAHKHVAGSIIHASAGDGGEELESLAREYSKSYRRASDFADGYMDSFIAGYRAAKPDAGLVEALEEIASDDSACNQLALGPWQDVAQKALAAYREKGGKT